MPVREELFYATKVGFSSRKESYSLKPNPVWSLHYSGLKLCTGHLLYIERGMQLFGCVRCLSTLVAVAAVERVEKRSEGFSRSCVSSTCALMG